ncbi:WD repeat and coiled-coil-containing protein-like [Seriola lalandi dorsalis]|uniref:WD repeat and coiled-coil-containing protein-like n=1 Tax=Seriola lalandi dorsalis TaxID=1841481 RepID=UPI000C6FB200|nr:WD repeat and coiled-coil-containing protein-like [Seriola lalandi dorsalis]
MSTVSLFFTFSIIVHTQKQLSENVFIDERRPVLLCDGKLCLQALQDLFNLTIVEMMYGPLWIVLVADADGFVPLTFKPKEELTVRNGKRKTTLRTPGSPETSCPSSPAPGQHSNTSTEASI